MSYVWSNHTFYAQQNPFRKVHCIGNDQSNKYTFQEGGFLNSGAFELNIMYGLEISSCKISYK